MRPLRDWLAYVGAHRRLFPEHENEWLNEAAALFDALEAEADPVRKLSLIAAHLSAACDEGYDVASACTEAKKTETE